MQRALALVFATLLLLGALAQFLASLFAMTFCVDNCDGSSVSGDPPNYILVLVGGACLVAIGVSVAFWCFVAFERPVAATCALVLQLGASFAVLSFWLEHSYSDGILIRWFAGFQVCGFVALALFLTRAERAPPDAG